MPVRRKPIRHKFHAEPSEADGQRFDSKAEAAYYAQLKIRQRVGEVVFFLRQVPFHLPGRTVYRVDFVVFECDGTVRFIDVKGAETETFRLKKRQVEELYPVQIEVVKAR
jgi:hypothetical protein